MRQRELAVLIKNLGKLTRSQRQRVVMELTAGEHKMAAVEVIEGIGASGVRQLIAQVTDFT